MYILSTIVVLYIYTCCLYINKVEFKTSLYRYQNYDNKEKSSHSLRVGGLVLLQNISKIICHLVDIVRVKDTFRCWNSVFMVSS